VDQGQNRPVWRDVRDILWDHRGRLTLGFALLLVSRMAGFVLPASSKFLLDEVVGKHRGELLMPLAAAVGAAALVQAVTAFALSQVLGVAAQRSIMQVRRRLQQRVMRLPIRYFDSQKTGVLIARIMSDAEGIRNLLGTGLVQLASSLLTAALALAVLLYLNWRLTVTTLVLLGAFAALMTQTFRWLRPLYRRRAEMGAQLTGRLSEGLSGIRVVKAYNAEKHEDLAFTRGIHRLFRTVAREITTSAAIGAVSILIFGGIGAYMLVAGGRAILSGEMTLGSLVMYVFFIGLLIAPVVRITDSATQLSEAFAGLERIREMRTMATEDEEDQGRLPLAEVTGDVAFQDVSFEYGPGVPVLKHVTFTAPAGSTTALVGPSGAGKSTLIGLVMAFHRPTGGRILVDGRDLREVRMRDLRAHLGVVLQDNFLFDGTIAENVAFSHPHASRAEIEEACRIAHCHDFIEGFEHRYDTMVGERGVKLSGGQRQRLAIARAILADPRILILDEATSNLDSESEALIQDGLRSLRRGRTTFVIAHRLSTIRSADQILVLEGGEIVERGSHDRLMETAGRYRQLYEKQYRATTDRLVNPGEESPPEAEAEPAVLVPIEPPVTPPEGLPDLVPTGRRSAL
jgi:subfamily B ATP-binding cassette protein MsbA